MTQRKTNGAAKPQRTAVKDRAVNDGLQNFEARLGIGTGNLSDATMYNLSNPITRWPRQLEAMYRGSWIVGAAVDAIADDMTREGVDFGSALDPEVSEALKGVVVDTQMWQGLGDTIRWSRLYGGAIGVLMVDGQDVKTPLRTDAIGQGSFRGILPLSRWELVPTVEQVIDSLGPGIGNPEFYKVGPMATGLANQTIHHSRVIRVEGVRLPYFQRIAEQGWGLSIVERMFDRLLAFDSATTGAAQLIFKAYLRTLKVEGLRKILAAGGPAETALTKNVEAIRRFQSSEGLTLIDSADDFQTHSYTFAGLDDVLLQFGQQLSGATEIPLVRLFGQSPSGLNSTGESDIRNYYDGIKSKQERSLRAPVSKVLDVVFRSVTGDAPPKGFNYTFNPLWQMTEKEKADTAASVSTAVGNAYDLGIISKPAALRELKQSAEVTGIFSNISDKEIAEAEAEPPEVGEGAPIPSDALDAIAGSLGVQDNAPPFDFQGLPIVIETAKGEIRRGGAGLDAWQVVMPADYGFIEGTWSAEGRTEAMDCFIGPDSAARDVWVVDQLDLRTGRFDEHKLMMGYPAEADAIGDYLRAYHDGQAFARIGGVTKLSIDALKHWLREGRLDQPLARR